MPDRLGHIFQFDGVLDLVVLDVPVDHFPEQIQHAHAVVGVGGAAAGHHAGEIPGLNGIDRGAADAHLSVRVFGVQPAGPHGAVLAAGRIRADGAGLHVCCAVKGGFNAVPLGLSQHLGRGFTDGHCLDIEGLISVRVFMSFSMLSSSFMVKTTVYYTLTSAKQQPWG